MDEVDKNLKRIREAVDHSRPGFEHFVLLGDASFGFVAQRNTKSTFTASFSPLFLWQPTDRLLVEAAMDVGVATDVNAASSTSVDLTITARRSSRQRSSPSRVALRQF